MIGPVQLSPGPYRQGQTLKANFTLRNDGARTGTWASSRWSPAGRGDQERDLGSATNVTLKPASYRLFTGSVKLDLAGRWHGWLIVGDGEHAGAARRRGAVRVHGGREGGRRQSRRGRRPATAAGQTQSRLSVGQ